MSHTLTQAADGLVSYSKYRFRMYAVNDYGPSDYSEELAVSIAPLPSQPAPVIKDSYFSTKSSIKVNWVTLPDTEPATGYKLSMKDDQTGITRLVYDGSSNPNVLTYIINNLITGYSYTFILVALNFNG